MKNGNIFWGLLLIVLGALIFLRNFDIFFFSWGSIFRLWPLIFIFWGISVLPVKSGMKALLSLAAIALGIILLASNPHGGMFWNNNWNRHIRIERDDHRDDDRDDNIWNEEQFSEDFNDTVEFATLNLDAAAGSFQLNGTSQKLFEFKTEGNSGPFSAKVRENDENRVTVDFSQKDFRTGRNIKNTVWMYLNENPVWKLNVDVGAAELDMDLTPFKVERIDIDGGASGITLKLGDKTKRMIVNIDAGATGLKILVPEASACEVQAHTILSGRDLDGFNKISNGLYQTPNFSDSANQIMIDIEAAVSGVKVERY